MKVLFLTDSLSDLDGVGRYAMRLIAALEALHPGLEPHILLARKHRPTSTQVPEHWRVEVALPPDYFYYMSRSRYWVWRLLSCWRVWRAARGMDLVHAIKDFPHSQLALDAARARGLPCVATATSTRRRAKSARRPGTTTGPSAWRRAASGPGRSGRTGT